MQFCDLFYIKLFCILQPKFTKIQMSRSTLDTKTPRLLTTELKETSSINDHSKATAGCRTTFPKSQQSSSGSVQHFFHPSSVAGSRGDGKSKCMSMGLFIIKHLEC